MQDFRVALSSGRLLTIMADHSGMHELGRERILFIAYSHARVRRHSAILAAVCSQGPLPSRRFATGFAALPPTGAGREPRPSRPARGVPRAVHAGSRIGSLREASWLLLVPVPSQLGGTSPAKIGLSGDRYAAQRD